MEITIKKERSINGRMVYRKNELSFDFEPDKAIIGEQTFSLLIQDTLQLAVNVSTKRILYLYGYFPLNSRLSTSDLTLPASLESALYIDSKQHDFNVGFNYDLEGVSSEAKLDSKNRILKIGSDDQHTNNYKVATGLVVGVANQKIQCMYISYTLVP